jgi:homoserine/homoserine lactone efflux protein
MLGYAALAAPLTHLVQNEKGMRTQNRIFGSLFIAAGALLSGASR